MHTELLHSVQSFVLLVSSTWVLAPVLATLTNTISSDTITALAASLGTLHLAAHDYTANSTNTTTAKPSPNSSSKTFKAPVSLNAAMFVAILLSSRLSSSDQVFCIVFIAIELFALSPIVRYHLKVPLTRLVLAPHRLPSLSHTWGAPTTSYALRWPIAS